MSAAISFARGVPAPDLLPAEELADCAHAALRDPAALGYAPGGGFPPLRAWLAERHGVEPERIIVTNGSLQGFVLLARHLLAAGPRRVLVEAPTYDRPLAILTELGAEIVPLPVDERGLDPAALERALAAGPAAFLYTIPTFQNPTGRTLPPVRRRRLADLARAHRLVVFEDDPYGLVRFEGDPPPLLVELEGGDQVVYSSSFSKTVAPGLRVGYLVLPPTLAAEVERAAVSNYLSPAVAGQAMLYEFLRRGALERNVERVTSLLQARRDAMADALSATFAAGRFTLPEGGYFLWVELPGGVDEARFVDEARAVGVALVAGADFHLPGAAARPAVRLAYSAAAPDEIAAGVARLGHLLAAPAAA